jgi:extracellular elastinolytic metalloproteinase
VCELNSVGINQIISKDQFNIYPNPAQNDFYINFNSNLKYIQFYIFNTLGEIIYSKNIADNENSILVNQGFLPGLYMVVLKTENQIYTEKLVMN